jgi:polyphosphate glucokinase
MRSSPDDPESDEMPANDKSSGREATSSDASVTKRDASVTKGDASVTKRTASFGIDIGGSGMKAAPVDLATGTLTQERLKIATPQPSTPDAMASVVSQLVEHFEWLGNVGVTFPSIVHHGVSRSAANIDKSWIGTDIDAVFTEAAGRPVHVINDADAAGLAEVRYGAGQGRDGVVILFTFGTGVGSGFFLNGELVPNTELGHLELDGHIAEKRAAASARDREGLSWKEWAARVNHYLEHIEGLFSPDLVIIGGGVSRKAEKWLPYIDVDVEVLPAALTNDAGIVGAALIA